MVAVREVEAGGELRSLEELRTTIVAGAAEVAAHQAWWLGLVAELDAREGWAMDGVLSCGHWLSAFCGISLRTAREHVNVARALRSLPLLQSRFAAGKLSYSKVRAVARVATPANEREMVDWAETLTASQLERVVSGYARLHGTPLTPEDEANRRAQRGVVSWTDREGMVHYEIVVAPEEGQKIDLALDYGRAEARKDAKETGEPPARGSAGRVDALLLVLRRGLVNAERGVMDESRHLIVTHVREASAFVDGSGNVDLGNGAVVHPRVLQRLACDSMLQGMLEGVDGRPLNLGRRVRTATRDQKTALCAVHRTCRWVGCEVRSQDCEFHHVDFWTSGGSTDLANLLPVCGRHHHLVHEGGWRMVLDPAGRVVVIPPDGRPPIVGLPPLSKRDVAADELVARNRATGHEPAAEAASTLFGLGCGERMSRWALGSIVEGLAWFGPPAGGASASEAAEVDVGRGHSKRRRRCIPCAPARRRPGTGEERFRGTVDHASRSGSHCTGAIEYVFVAAIEGCIDVVAQVSGFVAGADGDETPRRVMDGVARSCGLGWLRSTRGANGSISVGCVPSSTVRSPSPDWARRRRRAPRCATRPASSA